jgi:hypothetical protein
MREAFIQPEAVPMLERVSVHEAGHAVVASHHGANVLGIAFTIEPSGYRVMALYNTPPPFFVNQLCAIYAAGSAGEQLVYGDYGMDGASGDLRDIDRVGGPLDYGTLVSRASGILESRRAQFDRIATLLRERLHGNEEITMDLMPHGRTGAILVSGSEVVESGHCPFSVR